MSYLTNWASTTNYIIYFSDILFGWKYSWTIIYFKKIQSENNYFKNDPLPPPPLVIEFWPPNTKVQTAAILRCLNFHGRMVTEWRNIWYQAPWQVQTEPKPMKPVLIDTTVPVHQSLITITQRHKTLPSKQDALKQCWFNVGPASQPVLF